MGNIIYYDFGNGTYRLILEVLMPYPYMATLPIWITKCENAVVTDLSVLENDNYHNLIIQVVTGQYPDILINVGTNVKYDELT